ncbi:hypothetical protein K435DRAFT_814246, partial [Dendrothele bispora CBS 962.96]
MSQTQTPPSTSVQNSPSRNRNASRYPFFRAYARVPTSVEELEEDLPEYEFHPEQSWEIAKHFLSYIFSPTYRECTNIEEALEWYRQEVHPAVLYSSFSRRKLLREIFLSLVSPVTGDLEYTILSSAKLTAITKLRPLYAKGEIPARCINALAGFLLPIVEKCAEACGWQVTVIAGGPEPADNGRLNVISLHAGKTNAVVKQNFGEAKRTEYKEQVLPVFSSYLKQCY